MIGLFGNHWPKVFLVIKERREKKEEKREILFIINPFHMAKLYQIFICVCALKWIMVTLDLTYTPLIYKVVIRYYERKHKEVFHICTYIVFFFFFFLSVLFYILS